MNNLPSSYPMPSFKEGVPPHPQIGQNSQSYQSQQNQNFNQSTVEQHGQMQNNIPQGQQSNNFNPSYSPTSSNNSNQQNVPVLQQYSGSGYFTQGQGSFSQQNIPSFPSVNNQSQPSQSQQNQFQSLQQPSQQQNQFQLPQSTFPQQQNQFQPPQQQQGASFQELQQKAFAYNPQVHTSSGTNYTTPISAKASVQSYGGQFNAPPQPKGEFPYQVTCADYNGREVYLFDVNPKQLLLVYDGELQLSVTDMGGSIYLKKSIERFETTYGEKTGYVFWKATKKYMDCLDNLFTVAWREQLKVPLPVVTDRSKMPLLHSGTWNNIPYEVYEYSEASVALFIQYQMNIGASNSSLTHPTRGKIQGYIFWKKGGTKIQEIERFFGISIGDKFTLSPPVFTTNVPTVAAQPVLLKTGTCLKNDILYTIEQWRYSEAAYALCFSPNCNIENEYIKYSPTLYFGSVTKGGYIFAKASKMALDYMKFTFPEAILDDAVVIPTTLSTVIPAPKVEQRIPDLAISLLNKLAKCETFIQEEIHGKKILYGPTEEVETSIDSEVVMKLICGDKSLVIMKTD